MTALRRGAIAAVFALVWGATGFNPGVGLVLVIVAVIVFIVTERRSAK